MATETSTSYTNVHKLTLEVLDLLKQGKLFADEYSTVMGKKSICIIEEYEAKGIDNINNILNNLYLKMNNNNYIEKIEFHKLKITTNGERSFDILVYCSIYLDEILTPCSIYLNLTQGSSKVQKVTKKMNKASKLASEAQKNYNDLQSNIDNLVESTEKLKLAEEKLNSRIKIAANTEHRLQKAIEKNITTFWVRKLHMMFLQ